MQRPGNFYVVATPIGNLADLTYRAREVLNAVTFIICEDTRQTKKLLEHYKIFGKRLFSYHQHSSLQKMSEIASLLDQTDVAYVSDAGTPGICDPGGRLVKYLADKFGDDLQVIPIPGATAVITALSVSGFPADSFFFAGFIPHKKGRQTFLKSIKNNETTVVFYESVHRIEKLLAELIEMIPDRQIVVARELTKKFETIYRGTAQKVRDSLLNDKVKGEFVVVVPSNKFKQSG